MEKTEFGHELTNNFPLSTGDKIGGFKGEWAKNLASKLYLHNWKNCYFKDYRNPIKY
ncbi:hypothetical protein [Bacillus thuringiensis]|uniref:hypothetical protein n=1 Tax=Bacillus thuringiensis TaxID=1428 RepID=UPI0015F32753|nr:hypothetical protein [Bacillus thuringiensis]